MNHGLINKHYHTGNMYKSQDIYETYPELLRIYNYFLKTNRRDRYYIAMKYHAIKVAQQIYPGIVLEELAELINIKTHSSVIYYLYKYVPIIGHDDFISHCFDRFIDNYIYPETIKNNKGKSLHGLFRETSISTEEPSPTEEINKATSRNRRHNIYKKQ